MLSTQVPSVCVCVRRECFLSLHMLHGCLCYLHVCCLSQVVTIKGERIDHVACGSAHTLVWSTMRPPVSKCPLPSTIPVEYQLLSDIEPVVLRNRLILLQHFTDIFCSSLPLLSLYHSETDNVSVVANGNRSATAAHSGSAGSGATPSLDELLDRSTNNSTPSQMELLLAIDTLRRLLVSTKKESIFKKVVQATMERNRSHGRAIDINRFQVRDIFPDLLRTRTHACTGARTHSHTIQLWSTHAYKHALNVPNACLQQ